MQSFELKLSVPESTDTAQQLRCLLDDLGSLASLDRSNDVRLLVHELVTNSRRHAGGPVQLQIKASDGGMRVEVEDGHPVFQPSVQRPRFGQTDGMGLFLVDRLADRWGLTATGGGKVAWFEIHTDGRGTPAGR